MVTWKRLDWWKGVKMKQITIDDLIPLLKKGWVAYEEEFGWNFYEKKPIKSEWCWEDIGFSLEIFFNIAPFDGDWKQSLRRIK